MGRGFWVGVVGVACTGHNPVPTPAVSLPAKVFNHAIAVDLTPTGSPESSKADKRHFRARNTRSRIGSLIRSEPDTCHTPRSD